MTRRADGHGMERRRFLIGAGAAGASALLATARARAASLLPGDDGVAAVPTDIGAPSKPGKSLKPWKGKRLVERLKAENPTLTSPLTKAKLTVTDLRDPLKVEQELRVIVERLTADIKAGQFRVDDVQRGLGAIGDLIDRLVITESFGNECSGAGAEGDMCGSGCNDSSGTNCGRNCNEGGGKDNGSLCGGMCGGGTGSGCGHTCDGAKGNGCSKIGPAALPADRFLHTFIENLGGTEYLSPLVVANYRTEIVARITRVVR